MSVDAVGFCVGYYDQLVGSSSQQKKPDSSVHTIVKAFDDYQRKGLFVADSEPSDKIATIVTQLHDAISLLKERDDQLGRADVDQKYLLSEQKRKIESCVRMLRSCDQFYLLPRETQKVILDCQNLLTSRIFRPFRSLAELVKGAIYGAWYRPLNDEMRASLVAVEVLKAQESTSFSPWAQVVKTSAVFADSNPGQRKFLTAALGGMKEWSLKTKSSLPSLDENAIKSELERLQGVARRRGEQPLEEDVKGKGKAEEPLDPASEAIVEFYLRLYDEHADIGELKFQAVHSILESDEFWENIVLVSAFKRFLETPPDSVKKSVANERKTYLQHLQLFPPGL